MDLAPRHFETLFCLEGSSQVDLSGLPCVRLKGREILLLSDLSGPVGPLLQPPYARGPGGSDGPIHGPPHDKASRGSADHALAGTHALSVGHRVGTRLQGAVRAGSLGCGEHSGDRNRLPDHGEGTGSAVHLGQLHAGAVRRQINGAVLQSLGVKGNAIGGAGALLPGKYGGTAALFPGGVIHLLTIHPQVQGGDQLGIAIDGLAGDQGGVHPAAGEDSGGKGLDRAGGIRLSGRRQVPSVIGGRAAGGAAVVAEEAAYILLGTAGLIRPSPSEVPVRKLVFSNYHIFFI